MDNQELETIFNASPLIEAAVHFSREGLPLAWRCRYNESVEEIASIAACLFSMGFESGLIPEKENAQFSIAASNGGMLVRSLPDNTFLLVLSTRGYSLQTLERKLDDITFNNNFHQKEVGYGEIS
jgi:predicted regulator of Ras-like GTPase activity (Roadblock/LC7/MglB family)